MTYPVAVTPTDGMQASGFYRCTHVDDEGNLCNDVAVYLIELDQWDTDPVELLAGQACCKTHTPSEAVVVAVSPE